MTMSFGKFLRLQGVDDELVLRNGAVEVAGQGVPHGSQHDILVRLIEVFGALTVGQVKALILSGAFNRLSYVDGNVYVAMPAGVEVVEDVDELARRELQRRYTSLGQGLEGVVVHCTDGHYRVLASDKEWYSLEGMATGLVETGKYYPVFVLEHRMPNGVEVAMAVPVFHASLELTREEARRAYRVRLSADALEQIDEAYP